MSLRSVDLQMMIPRVGELGNVQQKQSQQGQLNQQHLANSLERNINHQQQTVHEKVEIDHPSIKKERDHNSRKSKKEKKSLSKMSEEDNGVESFFLGSNIDIKI